MSRLSLPENYKTYTYSMGGFKNEQDAEIHLDEQLYSWPNLQDWHIEYHLVQKSNYGWRCEFKLVQEIE